MKLGILIPKTSCVRLWKTPADTYFYIYTLKSFIDTNTDNILLHLFSFETPIVL